MELYQEELDSPVGTVYVVTDGTSLRAVDFEGFESRMHRLLERHYGEYQLHPAKRRDEATSRLRGYFSGDLKSIEDLKVATNGTDFQRQVWAALRTIPVGETISYSQLANMIGSANACRAVGLANGSNPIGIVVPCHRVIGKNKSLTGYGGGIQRKEWLLAHEGALPN